MDDSDLSPLVAEGWYVSGTFALTGERKSDGLDTPRNPFRPLLQRGGFGAIEVAARFESLTFGSAVKIGSPSTSARADNVMGNSDHALTLGMNWYLNRWVKIQANLIRERLRDPSMGPLPGRAGFWSRVRSTFNLPCEVPMMTRFSTFAWSCLLSMGVGLTPAVGYAQQATDFFDPGTLQEVRLFINSRDLSEMLERYWEDRYYPADFVWRQHPRAQCRGPGPGPGESKPDEARPESRLQPVHRRDRSFCG